MAKKKPSSSPAVPAVPLLPKRNWQRVGAGVATVIIGFVILSFTDSLGQNFASRLSPFLIVGGYVLIGLGLFQKTS